MKFKIQRIGPNPSAIAIVSFNQSVKAHFPPPGKPFKLLVDNQEYTTCIRNLASGWTSIAQTTDSNGRRVTRADFCHVHGLKEGQTVCIEAVAAMQLYRLVKICTTREVEATERWMHIP
ncbi:MAG: hypothetical protein DRI01_02905, partial [Chloroflexi bacterium]